MANIPGTPFNDVLSGTDFNDIINRDGDPISFPGTRGDDILFGEAGNDIIYGGTGHDQLHGGFGHDQLFGGNGDDILTSSDAFFEDDVTNQLNGGNGNDLLDGFGGNDMLNGGTGTDTAGYGFANSGVKVSLLLAGAQNTEGGGIDTLSSIENIVGSIHNDTLTGNAGDNVLSGLAGLDTLNGNGGNDTLLGGSNDDTLNGGAGNDTLKGDPGRDTLYGGSGKDTLTGGNQSDFFVYKSVSDSPAGAGRDVITDFNGNGAALGDQINLSAIDANGSVAGNQAFVFGGPFTAGHLRYVVAGGNGILQGNIDGDAAAEFEIQLTGAPAVHPTDIIV